MSKGHDEKKGDQSREIADHVPFLRAGEPTPEDRHATIIQSGRVIFLKNRENSDLGAHAWIKSIESISYQRFIERQDGSPTF